ncbi:MAG: hypothetical protein HN509_13755 [Halobacteriovoraceae bacterium]|jgi:hypothetical protein|nr:hypothetical protein [Halobacteriovoraceae bacterium]MBT5094166.1 hypothetical protein [Halobacteriovoraceae bacterium]
MSIKSINIQNGANSRNATEIVRGGSTAWQAKKTVAESENLARETLRELSSPQKGQALREKAAWLLRKINIL